MTRQYIWALKRRKAGLCVTCGKPAKSQHCKACWAKRRDYNRNRYRRKHGIPLDAPITRGRIRRT